MPHYLTPQDVATRLNRAVKTIYKYLEEGEFPNAKRIRRSYLIPEEDVQAMIERYTTKVLPKT